MFLALLRLFFALELTKKRFKALFETYRGANCQNLKSQINENFEKMPENKQSNLIANVKTPNIGFINKYIINSGIREEGGYSVLVNYQSLLSNIFPLALLPIIFLYKI